MAQTHQHTHRSDSLRSRIAKDESNTKRRQHELDGEELEPTSEVTPWGHLPDADLMRQESTGIDPAIQPPTWSDMLANEFRYLYHRFGGECANKEAERFRKMGR